MFSVYSCWWVRMRTKNDSIRRNIAGQLLFYFFSLSYYFFGICIDISKNFTVWGIKAENLIRRDVSFQFEVQQLYHRQQNIIKYSYNFSLKELDEMLESSWNRRWASSRTLPDCSSSRNRGILSIKKKRIVRDFVL